MSTEYAFYEVKTDSESSKTQPKSEKREENLKEDHRDSIEADTDDGTDNEGRPHLFYL